MKLIVGLGNPGAEYRNSRHNMGFMVIDRLAGRLGIDISKNKFQAHYGNGLCGLENVVLIKPQTFMNRSGGSVLEAMVFYKADLEELLVVYDDLALDLGLLRGRAKGSAGGHNGVKDIISRLGTDDFSRLRIGIGSPKFGNTVKHVLSDFGDDEQNIVSQSVIRAAEAVQCWVTSGIKEMMNSYNGSDKD